MPQNANDVKLGTVRLWLDAALRQVAAESYLHETSLSNLSDITQALLNGNTPSLAPPDQQQYVRLTRTQASAFLDAYEIVDHHANDASGFSATLLRRKVADPITGAKAGSYTLAIRSTEYKNPAQGGDFDRDGVTWQGIDRADGEIAKKGFAFAQIAALETYYENLKKGVTSTDPTDSSKLNTSGSVNTTLRDFFSNPSNTFEGVGYSLGAHLATVFTERHPQVVAETYEFNAAGRGTLDRTTPGSELARYEEMFAFFEKVLLNPDAAGRRDVPRPTPYPPYLMARQLASFLASQPWNPFELTPANLATDATRSNLYPDARYAWAIYATTLKYGTEGIRHFVAALGKDISVDSGAFSKITELFGHANFGDVEVTANSGVHAPTTSVFIEAQPFLEGAAGKLPFAPELTESLSASSRVPCSTARSRR